MDSYIGCSAESNWNSGNLEKLVQSESLMKITDRQGDGARNQKYTGKDAQNVKRNNVNQKMVK